MADVADANYGREAAVDTLTREQFNQTVEEADDRRQVSLSYLMTIDKLGAL